MRYIQIRYVVGCGFLCLGLAMVYVHGLSPQIDFTTLALMRGAQTACIGLLFAPMSTLAYRTLPTEGGGDATALFTMLRNLGGSIGISLATSVVTNRAQMRQATWWAISRPSSSHTTTRFSESAKRSWRTVRRLRQFPRPLPDGFTSRCCSNPASSLTLICSP
jgi:hypothetical protein